MNSSIFGNSILTTTGIVRTKSINSDYTVISTDQRVQIDATSGNIIITLPTITTFSAFKRQETILFKRIDTTANTVTFVGTGGNYDNEGLLIGDPRISTTKIYASDENIWRTGEIEDNFTSKEIVVNTEADFGTLVGDVFTLKAGTTYLLNQDIITANRFEFETGATIKLVSINLNKFLVYVGTGTMFTGDDFNFFHCETIGIVGFSFNQMFDLSGPGRTFFVGSLFTGAGIAGNIDCALNTINLTQFSDFGQGLTFTNIEAIGINNSFSDDWKDEGGTMFSFFGSIDSISLNTILIRPEVTENIFFFDPSLKDNDTTVIVNNCEANLKIGGAVFAPGSLRQDYVNSVYKGNPNIENSTSVVKLAYINNSAQTTINLFSENTVINSNVLYFIDSLIQRFLIQDICTFDNTTNKIDTTFNHGFGYVATFDNTTDEVITIPFHNMKVKDVVFLFTVTGTLPTGLDDTTKFFVINPSAPTASTNTFQLSLTEGGSAIDFTTDGSGTLFYRRDTAIAGPSDRIFLFTYDGTLPSELDADTEYFVINPTELDFQISLTQGGSAVTFTDDGSGILYYRHNTGMTELAQIIYIGNEDIRCSINGWVLLESVTGTKVDIRAVIMDIDINGIITESQIGSTTNVNSNNPKVSTLPNVATLFQGEGNIIFIRNDSDETSLIARDFVIGYVDVT